MLRCYNHTRDEFPDFISIAGDRKVSLDFNSTGKPGLMRGLLLAIPYDLTDLEKVLCYRWLDAMVEFFKYFGLDVPLHGNKGLIHAGFRGVIHTEPFFASDFKALEIVQDNAEVYAFILASTLGRIDGVSIILPHKKHDGGARTATGYNERDFAKYVIMPKLIRHFGATVLPSSDPIVTLEEV